jgi:ribonuclease E
MSKSMLINVILEEESRVAIVDNGVLDFFEIETLTKETLKGNIYKGVVENVNASLDAAFVDCGWERPGFLPLDEVNFRILPVLKGRKGGSKIQEHLHPGMELLVQVIRDRIGTKPPSVTTYYSLPGRYLVLTPYADSSGVSRRIEDEERRNKLKKIVDELRPPEKYGFIVRTAGLDQDRKELARDMGYLLRLWETIEQAASGARAPSLIYREQGLALRTIRDHLLDDVEEVLIDDEEVHEKALRFIRAVAPHQEPRIKLYTGDKPLFTRFNLEEQIETIYKRRVPLKSGGEIVIEVTEGLTAIDVNSSRSRESSVEELALRTNLEAAAEVARQLRLRDIGGLIVIDFIDMEKPKHLRAVEKALTDAMRPDKAKYDATKISKLGMMEISRQRLKAAKSTATYVTCVGCDGAGSVKTTEAAALSALRKIQTRVVRGDIGALGANVPTDVALYLLNQQRDELLALERRYDVKIAVTPRPDYPKERCELEFTPREGPAPAVTREGQKRRLEARDQRGSAARRAPAVGDDASLGETPSPRSAPASVSSVASIAGEGASPEAASSPGSAARTEATSPGTAASSEAAGSPHATSSGLPAPWFVPAAPGSRSLGGTSVWPALDPIEPPAEAAPAKPAHGGSTDLDDLEGESGESAPASVPGAFPGSFEDVGIDDKSAASAASAAAEHKRRRRRGGRGRKKHGAGEPAGALSAAQPHGGLEPETHAGGIIWEDAPEGAEETGAPATTGTRRAGKATVEPAEPAHEGLAGAKKRRRRRGGRGRGKGTGTESGTHPAHHAEEGNGSEELPLAAGPKSAHVGKLDAPARPKRTRRRGGKKHDAAHEVPGEAVVAKRTPRVGPAPAGSSRAPAGEEDVPGGWWSRLVGPKKRGDRED